MKRLVIVTVENCEGAGLEAVYTDSAAPLEIVSVHLTYDEFTDNGLSKDQLTSGTAHRRYARPLGTLNGDARRAWRRYLREQRERQAAPHTHPCPTCRQARPCTATGCADGPRECNTCSNCRGW